MTEDIFIYSSYWVKKKFVSGHQIQKKSMFMPTIFLSLFFHLLSYTNPNILMNAKELALALLLLRLSGSCILYGYRAIDQA